LLLDVFSEVNPSARKIFYGLPYTLINIFNILLTHLVFMRYYGILGLFADVIWSITFAICLDGFISTNLYTNIVRLRKNGFTDEYLIAVMLINIFGSQGLGLIVMYYICGSTPLIFENIFSVRVLVGVIVNLCLGEICFTAAHKAMHYWIPSLHKLHHCCIRASFSTNLLFEPLDLVLEFAGPVGVLALTHMFLWNENTNILLVSYMALQTWYALDHDEYLKLPHYMHHMAINSRYNVYFDFTDKTSGQDKVKALIIQ
jgi:hypothetical protein